MGAMADASTRDPVTTPRFETIVRMATEQARNRSHRYVGVEHLMLAILIEGQSIPAQVLERRVALSDALADLEQVMDSTNYGPSTTSQ
jgi:ATP-dependent Clp protease ATP-binding subunit ClpA